MSTAIEILSKIFDKDGVKYSLSDHNFEKIRLDSNICDIYIEKHYKAKGYHINVNCPIKDDLIKRSTGSASLVERFEIVRDKTNGLFVFGHSRESVQGAGEASFITTTKIKYPHHQAASITCNDNNCQLNKGRNWKD